MTLAPAEQQAVRWEVRLREAEAAPVLLDEFDRWRRACAANEQAWNALQLRLARMGGAGSHDAAALAYALRAPALQRRRALRSAFGLLVLGVGGWATHAGLRELGWGADWQSAVGERGTKVLADGTPLVCDAGSRIGLGGSVERPQLELYHGQLLVRSAAARRGALSVATVHGQLITAGAAFDIARMASRSIVSVCQGSVLLRLASGAEVAVAAGQSYYFDRHAARLAGLPFSAVSAWTRGICVADRMPVGELLERLARYRKGILRASQQVMAMSISGVFPLSDTERALLQLCDILPLRLRHYGSDVTVLTAA